MRSVDAGGRGKVDMTISFEELNRSLDTVAAIPDEEWLASLDSRKRKELEFHDRDRDRDRIKAMDGDTY